MKLLALVLALSGCGRAVHANVGLARGPDEGTIEYLWAEPEGTEAYPLVLYLDRSDCRSVTNAVAHTKPILELGMAMVLPEKKGVRVDDIGEHCSEEVLRANDREQRMSSAVWAVEHVRIRLTRWDGRIVVFGSSKEDLLAHDIARAWPGTVVVGSLSEIEAWHARPWKR